MGAGPGALDLLTLRAVRALQNADVVLYDRLIGDDILNLATKAERIYVGKEPQMNSWQRQERAHTLMIGHAREGRNVVRLKGGDPFVFGRGGEELLRLRGAGIPVEVVPGISSSIAAAASAWIPVSYRDLSPSFGVFAGHPGDGVRKVVDFEAAARVGTAVFLMGVARLEEIVNGLIEHGRDPHTPIALVERATLPDERVVTGTLSNIQEIARDVRAPATIIVGEVVDVRHQALSQLLPVQAKTS